MENKDHTVEPTKMVTAVEWLVEQLNHKGLGNYMIDIPKEIIDRAKQMEKEQIIKACACGTTIYSPDETRFEYAEQYYNEIYG